MFHFHYRPEKDRGDDYSEQGLPGIWHLDPSEDTFRLRIRRRGEIYLDVTRVQYPVAPWMAGTYNNQQGKTVRYMGHTIDFSKPDYFTNDEYTQHVYFFFWGELHVWSGPCFETFRCSKMVLTSIFRCSSMVLRAT